MAYSASTIAKWLIEFNGRFVASHDVELMTPLKLQKMLYYAQGAFLAINDAPLFEEEIEAWQYGPVVPSIYKEYRDYGANGIPSVGELPELDSRTYAMMFAVYERYAKHSAWELRDMTHNEAPYVGVLAAESKVITKEAIKEYFQTVYAKILDETIFDDIPIAEPAYYTDEGIPVFPKEADAQVQ